MIRTYRLAYIQLCLVFVCFPFFHLYATEYISKEIRITSQREDGKRYGTFRGIVYIQTSIETMKSVLTDHESCLKWMHQCKQSNILKSNSDGTKGYVHFIYKAPRLPWYLFFAPKPKDREMVLRVELIEDASSGKMFFTLDDVDPESEPDLADVSIPSDPSLILIKTLSIQWEITPVENDYLQVVLQIYSDPNHEGKDLGIIDRNTNEMVKRSLQNLRNIIEERGL